MNLSALTAKEVMRICQPETELEKRLFDIVDEIQRDLNDTKSNLEDAIDAIENDDSISSEDFDDFVREVMGHIKSGSLEKAIKALEDGA